MAYRRISIIWFILTVFFNAIFLVELSVSSEDEDRVILTGNEGASEDLKTKFTFESEKHSVGSQSSEMISDDNPKYKKVSGEGDEYIVQDNENYSEPEDDDDTESNNAHKSLTGVDVHTPDDERRDASETKTLDGDSSVLTGRRDVYHYGNASPKSHKGEKSPEGSEFSKGMKKEKETMSTWEKAQLMMKKRNENKMKKEAKQLDKTLVLDHLIPNLNHGFSVKDEITNKDEGLSLGSGIDKVTSSVGDSKLNHSGKGDSVDHLEFSKDDTNEKIDLPFTENGMGDKDSYISREDDKEEKHLKGDDAIKKLQPLKYYESKNSDKDADDGVNDVIEHILKNDDGRKGTSEIDAKGNIQDFDAREHIYPDDGLTSNESAMEHVYPDDDDDNNNNDVEDDSKNTPAVEHQDLSSIYADGVEDAYSDDDNDSEKPVIGKDDKKEEYLQEKDIEEIDGNFPRTDGLVQSDGKSGNLIEIQGDANNNVENIEKAINSVKEGEDKDGKNFLEDNGLVNETNEEIKTGQSILTGKTNDTNEHNDKTNLDGHSKTEDKVTGADINANVKANKKEDEYKDKDSAMQNNEEYIEKKDEYDFKENDINDNITLTEIVAKEDLLKDFENRDKIDIDEKDETEDDSEILDRKNTSNSSSNASEEANIPLNESNALNDSIKELGEKIDLNENKDVNLTDTEGNKIAINGSIKTEDDVDRFSKNNDNADKSNETKEDTAKIVETDDDGLVPSAADKVPYNEGIKDTTSKNDDDGTKDDETTEKQGRRFDEVHFKDDSDDSIESVKDVDSDVEDSHDDNSSDKSVVEHADVVETKRDVKEENFDSEMTYKSENAYGGEIIPKKDDGSTKNEEAKKQDRHVDKVPLQNDEDGDDSIESVEDVDSDIEDSHDDNSNDKSVAEHVNVLESKKDVKEEKFDSEMTYKSENEYGGEIIPKKDDGSTKNEEAKKQDRHVDKVPLQNDEDGDDSIESVEDVDSDIEDSHDDNSNDKSVAEHVNVLESKKDVKEEKFDSEMTYKSENEYGGEIIPKKDSGNTEDEEAEKQGRHVDKVHLKNVDSDEKVGNIDSDVKDNYEINIIVETKDVTTTANKSLEEEEEEDIDSEPTDKSEHKDVKEIISKVHIDVLPITFEDLPTYVESNQGKEVVPGDHSYDDENEVGSDDNNDSARDGLVGDAELPKDTNSTLLISNEEGKLDERLSALSIAKGEESLESNHVVHDTAPTSGNEENAKVLNEGQETSANIKEVDVSKSTIPEKIYTSENVGILDVEKLKPEVGANVENLSEEGFDELKSTKNDGSMVKEEIEKDSSDDVLESNTKHNADTFKTLNEGGSFERDSARELRQDLLGKNLDESQDGQGSGGKHVYSVDKEEKQKAEYVHSIEKADATIIEPSEPMERDNNKLTISEKQKEELINKDIEEIFMDSPQPQPNRDWKFFTIKPYINLFRTIIKKLDPLITEIIFMLPPSLQSLFLRAPFNMYPTHAFLLFVMSSLSLLVISIFKIFKNDSQKLRNKELKELLFEAKSTLLVRQIEKEEVLKELQDIKAELQQKETSLENGSVEMNRNLKAIIKECDSLKEDAFKKMESTRETRNDMKKVEADISKQLDMSKELQDSIISNKKEIKQMQDRRGKLQLSIDESELNSIKLEEKIQCLNDESEILKESYDQLSSEVENKTKHMQELQESVHALKTRCSQRSDLIETKDIENKALRRAISQLKVMQALMGNRNHHGDAIDNVDGDDVNDKMRSIDKEELIKYLIDVTQVRGKVDEAEKEKNSLKKSLSQLSELKINFNDELKRMMEETEKLEKLKEAAEQQMITSTTKIDVLSSYYKDREREYLRMLQEKEAKERAMTSQIKSADEKYKEVEKMVDDYKNRVENLRKELDKVHVDYEKQIEAQEKRLHENLFSARQIERDYEWKKQDAAMMRERLLQVKNKIAHLQSKSSLQKSSESLNTSANKEDVRPSSRPFLQRDGMPGQPEPKIPPFIPFPPPPFMGRVPPHLPFPPTSMIPPFPLRPREDSPAMERFRDMPLDDSLDERDRAYRTKFTPPLSSGPRSDPNAKNMDSHHSDRRGYGSHRTMNSNV